MIVVVSGNAFGGLKIYGPFEDKIEAEDWGEAIICEEWSAVNVESTEEKPWRPRLDKILDLCQDHGLVDEVLNELHCIEENGCRSSQM